MARQKKPKPLTELQLDELQLKYMADPNDREVFHEYFILLKAYARSLVLKEIKTKVYLEPDHVDGVATEAVLKMLNQYRKPGWKVWGSFAGTLRWKVVEALYENAEEESPQSLNAVIGGGESTQELGDIVNRIGAKIIGGRTVEDPQAQYLAKIDVSYDEIREVMADARDVLPYRLELLFQLFLLLRLRRPKTRLTLPAFTEFFLDRKAEEAFELLLLEIRNRLNKHAYEEEL